MTNNITLSTIYKEIELIKNKVIKIEEHMVDIDSIMTEDDYRALQDYEKEKSQGKLKQHEKLKKELEL